MAVELVILVYMICNTANMMALQQLMQYKICSVMYAMSHDFCNSIESNQSSSAVMIANEILSETAVYSSMKESIYGIPTLVCLLFLGSWSDRLKNGNKIMILMALCSQTITCLLLIVNSLFFDLHVILVALSCLPLVAACGITVGCASYINATCGNHRRDMRLMLLTASSRSGTVIGFALSGYVMTFKSLITPGSGGRE